MPTNQTVKSVGRRGDCRAVPENGAGSHSWATGSSGREPVILWPGAASFQRIIERAQNMRQASTAGASGRVGVAIARRHLEQRIVRP